MRSREREGGERGEKGERGRESEREGEKEKEGERERKGGKERERGDNSEGVFFLSFLHLTGPLSCMELFSHEHFRSLTPRKASYCSVALLSL